MILFSHSRRMLALTAGVLLLVGRAPLQADTVLIPAGADTTLMENYANFNFGAGLWLASGTIQNLTLIYTNGLGQVNPYAPRNRALIKFELDAFVPAGSIITGGYLVMDVVHVPPNDETNAHLFHEMHRVLRPWGEGTNGNSLAGVSVGGEATLGEATWNHRMAGTTNTWAIPGGAPGIDYAIDVSTSAYISTRAQAPFQFDTTTNFFGDLQFWLDNPGQNFGWMMIPEEEYTRRWTAKRFASREIVNNDYPYLIVEYTVGVPEPSTLVLFILAGAPLWLLRRARRAGV